MSATERTGQQRRSWANRTYPSGTHIPDNAGRGGIGEAEVVDGHALARIITQWCIDWEAERPGSWTHGSSDRYIGPNLYLCEQSGLHIREITSLRNGYREHVAMSKADRILQAMNGEHRLEGDLEPYPNPRWSPERWHAYMAERGCV